MPVSTCSALHRLLRPLLVPVPAVVLAVVLAACSSGGDYYSVVPGANPGAQCVMNCQQAQQHCLARSDSDRRWQCDAEASKRCDRISDTNQRQACMSQAQACMDQSSLVSCGQQSDRCMMSCGGS